MAPAHVAGSVGCNAGHIFVSGDPGQRFGQHGRIANTAAGDIDRADLQRLPIDPEIDLAPDAAFGTAMLAGVPCAVNDLRRFRAVLNSDQFKVLQPGVFGPLMPRSYHAGVTR